MHPFQDEKDVFDGGTKGIIVDIGGINVGLQICYDVRFPELSRALSAHGAEILLFPATA